MVAAGELIQLNDFHARNRLSREYQFPDTAYPVAAQVLVLMLRGQERMFGRERRGGTALWATVGAVDWVALWAVLRCNPDACMCVFDNSGLCFGCLKRKGIT